MYGGPGGPGGFGGPRGPHGPHGPGGFGCPHGPHGPYGPYGPYGHWHGGFYGPGPRFFYGRASAKVEYVDYMKTLEYDGEGQKYYNACACELCSKPFSIDYRLAKDVTFVSSGNVGFINSKFVSDHKVEGYFKFYIDCPECHRKSVFFVDIRNVPKFVLDHYLNNTKNIQYRLNYKFKDFYAYFDVLYDTNGTSINDIYNSINKLKFEKVLYSKGSIETNLELINNVVLDAYKKKTGIDGFIDIASIGVFDNIKSKKLSEIRYLLKSSGIRGLFDSRIKNDEGKREIKLLSR